MINYIKKKKIKKKKKKKSLFNSWPQKLVIEQILSGDISKFIEANKKLMPFVIFKPQDHDEASYTNLVNNLSKNQLVKKKKQTNKQKKKIIFISIIL